MAGMYAFRHQPIKGVYLTGQVLLTCFIRLPYWVLVSLPVPWRPRPSWTLKQCLQIKFMRYIADLGDKVGDFLPRGTPTYEAIAPGKEVKAVWLEPVPELIVGELKLWAAAQNVEPARIPGYWLHSADSSDLPLGAPPRPGEKVLLHFHGGAYKILSAHPSDPTSHIPRSILAHCAPLVRRTLSVEYRRASAAPLPARHAFPAALLDGLAGYAYLVRVVGFAPADIIVEGDSAGGNLSLALARYLVEHAGQPGLPPAPGRLLLSSPWVDIGSAVRPPRGSSWQIYGEGGTDFLYPGEGFDYSINAFAGALGLHGLNLNRYTSPASRHPALGKVSFEGFPPTFITAGGCECLLDEIRVLRDRMAADMGEEAVVYREEPDAIHDYLAFAWEPAATESYRAIARWLGA
ncbi:Alpha/Beta hydrolase protein [Schizophyllum fasciatum]